MMIIATTVLQYISLALISWQDYRRREVHIIWLASFMVLSFLNFYWTGMPAQIDWTLNLGFVAVQLMVLSLIFSLKNGKRINIINTYLGPADVLVWLALCFQFSYVQFVIFFVGSSLVALSLPFFSGIQSQNKKAFLEIPLAGVQASIFILILLADALINAYSRFDNLPF